MLFQLSDSTTPSGNYIASRLHEDLQIWLTTIDAKGIPQSTPVWFLWDEGPSTLLIYSLANAKRLKHIQQNPSVTLHLDAGNREGNIIITGVAHISGNDPRADQFPAWIEKYHDLFLQFHVTPKQIAASTPVPLRICPITLHYIPVREKKQV